jgi:hypothetical protein
MNYIFEESALNFFNIFIIIVIKFPWKPKSI